MLGIFIEIIRTANDDDDDEIVWMAQKLKQLLNFKDIKKKKLRDYKLKNLREQWHRKINVPGEEECEIPKKSRKQLSRPQKPDEDSENEKISLEVELTKQYLPRIKQRILKQTYRELQSSSMIVKDGEIITKLYQCKRMLEAFAKIQKPIDDEFRNLLSFEKLKADWGIREWYQKSVKKYGNYMKPYLHVMLYLLRCKIKKQRRLLEEYASERWQVVTNEEHQKLFDSMKELEDKMKIDRRISSYIWREENQNKFTCDSEMYYKKSLEEFNKMQKNKLKVSERIMTLFEIEHTQQIVEHTRNEFLRLEQMETENYGDVLMNYIRLEKRAKKIKEDIKEKSDLNCNLHDRMIILRAMFKHLIDQLLKLFNYYLNEKKCTDVDRLPIFDLKLFSEILGEKPRECMEYKRDYCIKDLLDLILIPQKDICDKKKVLRVTDDDSDYGAIIEEGSDHVSTAEELIDNIIKDIIPTPTSKPPSISFSNESDYLEKMKDVETLVEEAIEDQKEKEIEFKLVGDELNILQNIEPGQFVKERLEIIFDTIRKNKEFIAPIFERFQN